MAAGSQSQVESARQAVDSVLAGITGRAEIMDAVQPGGMVAFARGEADRGVRLCAMAATRWPVIDLPHEPARAAIERQLAEARVELGEDAWRVAWSAGEAMSVELALAEMRADAHEGS